MAAQPFEITRAKPEIFDQIRVGDRILDIDFNIDQKFSDLKIAEANVIQLKHEIANLQAMRAETIKSDLSPEEKEKATIELMQQLNKCVQSYGEAIGIYIAVIFGDENTMYLLSFFENHYDEMLNMCMPYINQQFMPKVLQYVEQRRQNAKAKAKFTKGGKTRKFHK